MRFYQPIVALAVLCLMPIGLAEAGAIFVMKTTYLDKPGRVETTRMSIDGSNVMMEMPEAKDGAGAPPEQFIFLGERCELAVLGLGERVEVAANQKKSVRFILVAGKPLNEPVVNYGPFVMNTQDEIRQAVANYQSGRF
ncbi:MAG: hypothetical protein EXQ99_01160 [Alphaproteobacteria bacterium]|nr:hypothetical protein [Alphaproteobacteria bacterium]